MADAPHREYHQQESHDNRTETPNLVRRMKLSIFALGLYTQIKGECGDLGVYTDGQRELAELCRISQKQVSRAIKELKDRGLITTRTVKGRMEIRIVNIWGKNHRQCGYPLAEDMAKPKPPSESISPIPESVSPMVETARESVSPIPESVSPMVETARESVSPIPESVRLTPPDPPIRTIRTEGLHTHTQSAGPAREGESPPPPPAGVCVSKSPSKFSRSELRRYAQANKLGGGWVTDARRSGEWDEDVAEYLAGLRPPVQPGLPGVAAEVVAISCRGSPTAHTGDDAAQIEALQAEYEAIRRELDAGAPMSRRSGAG